MVYSPPNPNIAHPDRWLFHRARQERNVVLETNVELDQKIELLQRQASRTSRLPNFSAKIEKMKLSTRKVLEKYETDGSGTWIDFYRLLSHHELLPQIIYTPLAFESGKDTTYEPLRNWLADGVYGVSAKILESALEHYDHPDTTEQERQHLQGVINEHTAMALLNYDQDPNDITIPASAGWDIGAKTDLVKHLLVDGEHTATPIQVKSSYYAGIEADAPIDGIIITGQSMGNSAQGGFRTARAIVAEVTSYIPQNEIQQRKREGDAEHLVYFRDHFTKELHEKLRAQSKAQEYRLAAA